jgi:hypothetical protein
VRHRQQLRGRRGGRPQSPRLCCLLTIPPRVHRRSRRRRWALRLLDTGVRDGDGVHSRHEPVEKMEMRMRWDGGGEKEGVKGREGDASTLSGPMGSTPRLNVHI